MARSLFSDSHPLDVQDLRRGVSIGGLGKHALNVLWRVTRQASHDNEQCRASGLMQASHAAFQGTHSGALDLMSGNCIHAP